MRIFVANIAIDIAPKWCDPALPLTLSELCRWLLDNLNHFTINLPALLSHQAPALGVGQDYPPPLYLD